MDIFFPAVLIHPFDPGILVYESRRYDTCRDRDHADAEECDEDPEHLPKSGDRIDVSIPDGQKGGGSPPDS